MQRQPLILSPSHDIHAAAATWGLRQQGVEAIWSKSGSLNEAAIGGLSFHTAGDTALGLPGVLSAERLSAVWYRRVRVPEQFAGAQPCDSDFLREEWNLFQRNFWALAGTDPRLFWINSPAAAHEAENKLVQLNAAIRCGLRVPPTLVSNDPVAVAQFRRQYPQVIYKPFSVHSWVDEEARTGHIAHAQLLHADMAIDDASIRLCPGIYQGYVDKVADLRVTVIGNRYFATRLGTTAGSAFVDWRGHVDSDAFLAQPCDLPGPVWDKLQALMAQLGLVFGCVDLVLDRDGELHFLEVNQAGQFLFVERWTESQPVLQAICAMLAEGRADYSLDAWQSVSYRSFRESDAYQVWIEADRAWVPSERERRATLSAE